MVATPGRSMAFDPLKEPSLSRQLTPSPSRRRRIARLSASHTSWRRTPGRSSNFPADRAVEPERTAEPHALPQGRAKPPHRLLGPTLNLFRIVFVRHVPALPNDLETRKTIVDGALGETHPEFGEHALGDRRRSQAGKAEDRESPVLLLVPAELPLDRRRRRGRRTGSTSSILKPLPGLGLASRSRISPTSKSGFHGKSAPRHS